MFEMRHRIGTIQATFMIGAALLVDVLQGAFKLFHAIPLVGTAIAIVSGLTLTLLAWVGFYVWFKINGLSLIESGVRKVIIFFGGALIELIPIINALPMWTFSIVVTIVIVHLEDRGYNREQRKRQQEFNRASRRRMRQLQSELRSI